MGKNVVAFTVAIIIGGPCAWAADYTITTIDFPGATSTWVSAVNVFGRAAGSYVPAGSNGSFGFTERDGTFTSVGDSLPCRPSGRCHTGVVALNIRGEVAGTFSADVDFPGAFVEPLGGAPMIIEPPGYPNTAIFVAGLNAPGLLAGCYSNETQSNQIFEQIGGIFRTISLPIPGVLDACARGLNNLGQLTGSYETSAGSFGFVLSGTHFRSIELPVEWGGANVQPMAINDSGVVIGSYAVVSGPPAARGFAAVGGHVEKIDFPGATSTQPFAINDRGEILGNYQLSTDTFPSQPHTFILRNGVYSTVTLPLPGPVTIVGIDQLGRLFGAYSDAGCDLTCPTHGFIATPQNH